MRLLGLQYFYISMNLFSVINSLMTEKGELITWPGEFENVSLIIWGSEKNA